MNTLFKTIIVSLTCLSLSSCSLFSSSTQTVTIESSNPQASIRVNGRAIGTGTATTALKKNKTQVITADYEQQHGTAIIESSLSTTGKLDIVGTFFFLFPVLGFLNEGAWTLDQDYVRIDMQ